MADVTIMKNSDPLMFKYPEDAYTSNEILNVATKSVHLVANDREDFLLEELVG